MKLAWALVLALAASVVTAPLEAIAASDNEVSPSPSTDNHRRWRIAYYEGGPQGNYYRYLLATLDGLVKLGWLPELDIPEDDGRSTKKIWEWLSANAGSEHIEFLPDGYYSANWDGNVRKAVSKALVERLAGQKDIDLVIAMGTWAGQDLSNSKHSVPTIVMSSSDPVRAGIISSTGDSGLDHVHARVDPARYERQVRVFHDVIGFKRLGVAYENTKVGRSYAAIDMIERVAAERGFEITRCYTQSDIANQELAGASVIGCFEQLIQTSDAIYVTVQGGVNGRTLPELVAMTNESRVPTFSQLGSEEVRQGLLLSISRAGGFGPVGRFLAATMGKVFNGAKPRQLNQVFEDSPNIAINLKTAELVGVYLFADVLAAADEIYREIDVPR